MNTYKSYWRAKKESELKEKFIAVAIVGAFLIATLLIVWFFGVVILSI